MYSSEETFYCVATPTLFGARPCAQKNLFGVMARRSYHYAEQRNGDHYDQEQPTYESIDVHVHRPAESNNQVCIY